MPCAHHTRDRDGNSVCGYKRYDKQLKDNRYIYMYNRYMYILYIYIHYKIIIFLYTYTHTNTHTHIYSMLVFKSNLLCIQEKRNETYNRTYTLL